MITGTTRLYAIVADPISQVRTPQVLNQYFETQGHDGVLVPMHVKPDGLADVVNGFRRLQNFGGFIVTVPHKAAVAALCDELGPAARAIGAVNAVRRTEDGRLIGEMFDGYGFVTGLTSQGHDPAGRKVLLLGSGGAAGAIAFALVQANVAQLTIANRTQSKAQAIVERVVAAFPDARVSTGTPNPQGFDIIVNATSLGMKETDPLPIDVSLIEPRQLVAEIIMKPEHTALLQQARKLGCPIHLGRHMLDAQARLMAEFMQGLQS
jgi:shikimate dehydrogenase